MPRLLIPYSFALPPVECCFGTRPIHAANSRPLRKAAPLPIEATIAVATNGPMLGRRRSNRRSATTLAHRRDGISVTCPGSSPRWTSLAGQQETSQSPMPCSRAAWNFTRAQHHDSRQLTADRDAYRPHGISSISRDKRRIRRDCNVAHKCNAECSPSNCHRQSRGISLRDSPIWMGTRN